uniref:(northern house mosquito) hypothetical protein n=1 Tax=Culex pipiens TaxID=7175 RepID=A0A8D8FR75_CULPI
MFRHPLVLVAKHGKHDYADGPTDAGAHVQETDGPNQLDEELLVGAGAQEEEQHHDHRQNDRDGTQREEELGRDHKRRNQEAPDLVVAGGERVVHPAAPHEEPPLVVVVHVRQRPEAVRPQAQPVQLRARNAVVADEPAGRRERHQHRHQRDHKHPDAAISGQRATLHHGNFSYLGTPRYKFRICLHLHDTTTAATTVGSRCQHKHKE